MGSDKHLVIAAAGTGGHVMPGLAVAAEMIARGWEVSWLGTEAGMEKMLVSKKGIEFDAVDFSGVRGHGLAGAVSGAVKLAKAFPAAKAILQKRRATAFFSTGGYIAVPSAIAAHRMGIPAVVMNCDAASLLSVRLVLPFIDALACGFEGEAAERGGNACAVMNGANEAAVALYLQDKIGFYDVSRVAADVCVFSCLADHSVRGSSITCSREPFPCCPRSRDLR